MRNKIRHAMRRVRHSLWVDIEIGGAILNTDAEAYRAIREDECRRERAERTSQAVNLTDVPWQARKR